MSKSPEPIILAVALFLLALGAGALAYCYPKLSEITGITDLNAKGHPSAKMKPDDVQAALAIWTSPVLWQETAESFHGKCRSPGTVACDKLMWLERGRDLLRKMHSSRDRRVSPF